MSYTVRSLLDLDLAQDAFQETFLRAFRAYSRLPETANHRAWLYRIASNVCHDARRQRARRPLPLDEALLYGDSLEDSAHELAVAVEILRGLAAPASARGRAPAQVPGAGL